MNSLDYENHEINYAQTEYKFSFIPAAEQIHQYALKKPNHTAVICGGEVITYDRLDRMSNKVANAIYKRTKGNNVIIGVVMERSGYVYAVEQGILKAKAAFLPFVDSYPDGRISFCMEDAGASVLITSKKLVSERPGLSSENYELITIEDILSSESEDVLSCNDISETDLAYCIYTSGSTGRPKGVLIEQKNLSNYVNRNEKSIEIMHYAKDGRIALAMAAISFDVSIVEQFVPLCNGQTVCLATEEEIRDPFALAKLIKKNNVNSITCTPTFLLNILDIPVCKDTLKQIDFFDIGAEAFPEKLYNRLRELNEKSIIMNVYGPTECTMGCSAAEITGEDIITIGKPMANTVFFVMNEEGKEVGVNEKGELIICGDCVGRGYVNLPEKTHKAFFTYKGMRAYHSGDMACVTEDGQIRLFGRIDNQVKLRGFRIELDEIEHVLGEFPAVSGAAVKLLHGRTDYLAGYYLAYSEIDPKELKCFMSEKLPEYMIPSVFMKLDRIPQTVNGKIDRNALPDIARSESSDGVILPHNETESYVRDIFAEILQIEPDKISIDDDFFDLGGDSLKSMMLASSLCDRSITSSELYALRSVKRIAEELDKKSEEESLDDKEDRAREKSHKLTPMQEKMIDCQFMKLRSTMWNNMTYFMRFNKKTDPQRLCDAVNKAIRNHPALAMKIYFDNEQNLVQKYSPEMIDDVVLEKMSNIEVMRLKDTLVRPFKMFNSALFRIRMFLTEKYTYMFFDVHHLAMDGSSLGIFFDNIVKAYHGEELKRDYYCYYLETENKLRDSVQYEEDKKYFKRKYGNRKWVMRPMSDLKEFYGKMVLKPGKRTIRLPFDEEDLAAAEKSRNTTRSVMAIAAALLTLHDFTGENNIMTNWIFNNRIGSFASGSVGMMIKNLPVGVCMDRINGIDELLKEIKRQVTDGITHCSYDYFFGDFSPFVNEPMEVNYQQNINADGLSMLHPMEISLEDDYFAPGAALEIEFVENEDGKVFDSEIEWAANMYSEKMMKEFHNIFIDHLESLVLDIPATE
ncbi:MAG: amino acid adenylation domain-containing protein [Firmicutes bacterium]|nr:amino acid adenylation domain-containing protein [Bacillota bacterium]